VLLYKSGNKISSFDAKNGSGPKLKSQGNSFKSKNLLKRIRTKNGGGFSSKIKKRNKMFAKGNFKFSQKSSKIKKNVSLSGHSRTRSNSKFQKKKLRNGLSTAYSTGIEGSTSHASDSQSQNGYLSGQMKSGGHGLKTITYKSRIYNSHYK
jgi:hypothetical protein